MQWFEIEPYVHELSSKSKNEAYENGDTERERNIIDFRQGTFQRFNNDNQKETGKEKMDDKGEEKGRISFNRNKRRSIFDKKDKRNLLQGE